MSLRNAIGYVRVPADLALTPRVLIGVARKLPVEDLYDFISTLIEELDIRHGDPDFELEPDEADLDDDDNG